MADEPVDPVQPLEGQGGGDTQGGAPYQEYLDRIPEELRGDVEPVFKDWDSNTTKKFQEQAQYREQWKPYEELGVNQMPPEQLGQLLEVAQYPDEQYRQWVQGQAEALGLTPQEAEQALETDPEQYDGFDPEALGSLVDQRLQKTLGPLQSQVEQFTQWQQQQEQNAQMQQAEAFLDGEFAALRKDGMDAEGEEWVKKLLPNHLESDPQNAVKNAYKDYQALRGEIEKGVFAQKAAQPDTPERGGRAVSEPDAIHTFKQAGDVLTARLREARQQQQ